MKFSETNNGKKGGLLKGKPHYDSNGNPVGGIKAVVTDSNKPVELEGGEVIINKEASKKYWKELSKINQSAGNGVPIGNPNSSHDEDPEEYKEGGRVIEFNPNHLPNRRILAYAKRIKSQYPKVWDLGGNIFGNEAFKNLQRVSERGYWLESEKWMYVKWRSFVARHTHDFRIKGVIAMLKWVDKVDKGWDYMKDLIEKEIEKKYPSKMEKGGNLRSEGLHIIIKGVNNHNKYGGSYKKIFDIIEKDIALFNPYGTESEELIGDSFHIHITPTPENDAIQKISKLKNVEIVEVSSKMEKGGKIGETIQAKPITYTLEDYNLETANRYLTEWQIDRWRKQGRSQEQINKDIASAKKEIKNVQEKTPYTTWYLELPKGKYTFKIGNSTYKINTKIEKVEDLGWKSKNWKKTIFEVVKADDIYSPFDENILKYLNRIEKKEEIANRLNYYFKNSIQEDIDEKYLPNNESKMEKGGKLIKRADGTYSKRGLWDNIRDNIGSGKKPTKQMLEQERKIKSKMEKGGLIAPNGKPSNLTPEQYKLVRTKAFKDWFGDWENDPKNASKVIDENGEPLVVYHGSRQVDEKTKFNTFNVGDGAYGKGIYFTSNFKEANGWALGNFVYNVFLNVKNPFIENNYKKWMPHKTEDNGFDGIIQMDINDISMVIVFEPNQIKLADVTNTTFDGNNPDIRYAVGGELAKGIKAEMEHIDTAKKLYNHQITPKQSPKQIAKDHLKENPKYYTELEKFEKKLDDGFTCEIIKNGERQIDSKSIEKLTRCIESLPQTKDLNMVNGEYTKERLKLHKQIIDEAKKGVTCITKGKPIAVLMGGSPASGKTTFLKKYRPYLLLNNIFKVDADEVRAKLPEYKGWNASQTHKETGDIVKTLISDRNIGIPCLFDFIYDGTMTGVSKYQSLIDFLKKEGYIIYIVFMGNIPKNVVKKRALERYKSSGRFVPMGVIDEFYETGEQTLNTLKNEVDGYIVVDASSPNYEIIEKGGKELPNKRIYEKLGDPIKLAKGGKINESEKRGDCYESAGKVVMDYKGINNRDIKFIGTPYVVHAEVSGQGQLTGVRFGHAFIEDDFFVYDFSNGRNIVLPKIVYYKIGQIKEVKPRYYKYTFDEAMKKMRETTIYGPWDLKTKSGL